MQAIDETIEQIDATIAQLRERRRALKVKKKVSEHRLATLMRRKQRLLTALGEVDNQIAVLQEGTDVLVQGQRRRGRPRKIAPI